MPREAPLFHNQFRYAFKKGEFPKTRYTKAKHSSTLILMNMVVHPSPPPLPFYFQTDPLGIQVRRNQNQLKKWNGAASKLGGGLLTTCKTSPSSFLLQRNGQIRGLQTRIASVQSFTAFIVSVSAEW